MVPKESGFNQSETASGQCACTSWCFPGSPVMTAACLSSRRHNLPSKVRLYNVQTNCTERLHADATIMRSFQTELFSSFLPSTYAGHVNLAAMKPWQFMPNWKHGTTVEFISFHVSIYRRLTAITSYLHFLSKCSSLFRFWFLSVPF